MKLSSGHFLKESFKLWTSCLIELLLYLPIWIVFKVYVLPSNVDLLWLYVLPLLSLAGILLRKHLTIRWKQLIGSLLLGMVLGLLSGGISLSGIYLAVAGCLCSYLGITAFARSNPFRVYWAGIAVYFIAAIFFHRIPDLQDSSILITRAGSVCLVLALLMTNRNHLRYSSLSGDSSPLPQGLRRHNLVFVFIFVIVAALLAAGVGQALGFWVWNSLRRFISWVSRLFSASSPPTVQEEAPPPMMPEMPVAESDDPGLLALILNISFYIIGIAAVGVIIYFLLRWLYRNTGGIWHKAINALLSMLRREQSPPNNSPYVDEEKSVFTWEKTVQGIKDFWKSKFTYGTHRDLWENMDGSTERVRWIYRQWLHSKRKDGYEAKSYLTPQETGTDVVKWANSKTRQPKSDQGDAEATDKLMALYDKARYGEKEPSATVVTALKEKLKF
ncbi:MAG: hypothetical protein K6T94_18250 [Paenibacillus sp.]|nr:hypothetical protein [Paenibacillus sp.]